MRTLLELGWHREADGTVVGTVVADAFCHSMVRSLVGAVVPVGEGAVRWGGRWRSCAPAGATPRSS